MNHKPSVTPKRRGYLPRFKMTKVVPHVANEPDWEVEPGQNSVAKAFIVLLVLHVIGVGGLLIYSNYKKNRNLADNPAPAAILPDAQSESASESPAPVSNGSFEPSGRSHVVGAGETPEIIAARYNVPVAALIRMNQLDVIPMQSGMPLRIPNEQVSTPEPIGPMDANTTLPGDTLSASPVPLAPPSEFPMDENGTGDLVTSKRFEELTPNMPPPSDVEVPKATAVVEERAPVAIEAPRAKPAPEPVAPKVTTRKETPAAKPAPAPAQTDTKSRTHKLKAGDTAYSLARRYGVSVKELLSANGISDPGSLQIGRELKIPGR